MNEYAYFYNVSVYPEGPPTEPRGYQGIISTDFPLKDDVDFGEIYVAIRDKVIGPHPIDSTPGIVINNISLVHKQ